jgi:hypothetical protein
MMNCRRFSPFIVVLLAACADESPIETKACSTELRTAVLVSVDDNDLPIDSVTATNQDERTCGGTPTGMPVRPVDDAGDETRMYTCWEQGGGTYVVRVKSGELTWTQRTTVAANECHTSEVKSLHFVLDRQTAD